eukprot:scaffold97_cov261-Pinguiococcus_pyrenoidosus.AAC.13
MPPVTMRPTPPRALSAKNSPMARRPWPHAGSSSPVCMDPMTTRLRRVVCPRSSGCRSRLNLLIAVSPLEVEIWRKCAAKR